MRDVERRSKRSERDEVGEGYERDSKEIKETKEIVTALWAMRHMTVEECLAAISQHPALRFFLTGAGFWFLMKGVLGVWMTVHLIYFVGRVFHLVLS